MSQRKYDTKPFKEEALRLVSQEGVALTPVAKDLGLDANRLRRWRKETNREGPKAFRGHGFTHAEELTRLKRERGGRQRIRELSYAKDLCGLSRRCLQSACFDSSRPRLCENSEFSGFRGCLTPCLDRALRIQAILGC